MTRLEAFGIAVEVPERWDARAFRHDEGEPTLHAASFRLPPSDGEFGTRATAAMPDDGLFLALTEYRVDAAELRHGIFAQARPARIEASALSPHGLLLPLRGQRGVQRFFSTAGRAFCLYVVSAGTGTLLLADANRLLAGLAVAPRGDQRSTT